MLRTNESLDALFQEYRLGVTPDASPHFMPKLWEKIDARRSFTLRVKRVAQVFMGSAAAICLLLTGIMVMPADRSQRHEPVTYVDVLAEAHPTENLSAQGIKLPEAYEARR